MQIISTEPRIQIFDIERDFGLKKTAFLDFLRPTYSVLHLDPYDAKRSKVELLKRRFPDQTDRLNHFLARYYAGTEDLDALLDVIRLLNPDELCAFDRIGMTDRRKRSIARFVLRDNHTSVPDRWRIERVPAKEYVQNVAQEDARSLVRKFKEAPDFVTAYPPMHVLLRRLAGMVQELRPDALTLEVNLHQMFVFADMMDAGDNSPEGVHQDGADFIVSAIVIERAGIIGGESVVYAGDKKTELLRRTLGEGEGIFQDDRTLWHYVTPVREDPAVPPDYGHRSIIGFDITIVDN